ncbi:MAG: tRNA (N6-isopentenyl adenosine(37)-C2)-methylthiotransferase MiaB [Anaerolineae bacterium]
MKQYYVWSIGCQMNDSESRRAAEGLEVMGYLPTRDPQQADVILLNTCVVRQSAEDKAYGRLTSLKPIKEKRPETVIALMGCLVGQEPDRLRHHLPYVDVFLPPAQIEGLFSYLHETNGDEGGGMARAEVAARWRMQEEESPMPALAEQPVAAYVSIIHGCNRRCTFCIVPHRRGPQRSRPIPEVVEEVEGLVARGSREVTMLGQIVDCWGQDLPGEPGLGDLLRAVHEVEGIERIRFLTSHPMFFNEGIVDAVAELPKVCEHIEIPIQAGDDVVLKRMARGYKVEAYRALTALIRERIPHAGIATDIIVGFPGETDSQFQATLDLLEEQRFDVVHVAAFSPRAGTYAADHMEDDVPHEEKVRRRKAVDDLQERIAGEINARLLGETVEVLVEEEHKGKWKGRTRTNKLVFFEHPDEWRGRLAQVRLTRTGPWSMQGEVVAETVSGRPALAVAP